MKNENKKNKPDFKKNVSFRTKYSRNILIDKYKRAKKKKVAKRDGKVVFVLAKASIISGFLKLS